MDGFRNIDAAAMALALLAGCAGAEAPEPAAIGPEAGYEDLAARLSGFVAAEMEHKRIPALALALVDGDRIVWARGFGEAQPGVPTDVDTLFRVGSVSKLFTDIAVVARRASGQLDLDAEVSELLPGFAPAGVPEEGGVTLRRLMAHRAGLVREPPVGHYFDDTAPSLATTAEVDLVFDLPGRSRPWAIEIKRGSAPKVSRGFAIACADLDAERAFVAHGGRHRYPMGDGVEEIGLPEMAALLRDW